MSSRRRASGPPRAAKTALTRTPPTTATRGRYKWCARPRAFESRRITRVARRERPKDEISSPTASTHPDPRSRALSLPQANVRGLRDVDRDSHSESDDGGPAPQEWYTGGASSGQAVIDPRERPDERLASMFRSARASGAVDGTADDLNPNAGNARRGAFTGRGRTLNSTAEEETENEAAAEERRDAGDGIVTRVVTFWQNGFTVDDGPLRTFDDPENLAFMDSIARGEAPAELAPRTRTERVNINLMQRHEPYVPPKEPKYKAFSGSGRTLADESSSAPSASAASTPSVDADWTVDESQPTTSIQIRLRDGSRLVAKFNTSHTVGHIRSFIAKSRPGETFAYSLQLSGFPPATLDDDSAVIGDAGLSGAVVIQR